jgi:large subunit ribosomal protein L14
MIFNLSVFKVCDNSGVKSVKCFNIQKNDIGQASIKDIRLKNKLKKGNTLNIVIVRRKRLLDRRTGGFISFDFNECIVLNQKNEFLGSRIFGPLPLELRKIRNLKILSLSSGFI